MSLGSVSDVYSFEETRLSTGLKTSAKLNIVKLGLFLQSVIMLSVITLSVVLLSVDWLSVIRRSVQSVIMLSGVSLC